MRTPTRIVAAGFALALSFGLAACGEEEKPTRQEAIDGWEKILNEQFDELGYSEEDFEAMGLTGDRLDAYYECFVDAIYDDVSAGTLRGLASGDSDASVADEDQPTIEAANQSCLADGGF